MSPFWPLTSFSSAAVDCSGLWGGSAVFPVPWEWCLLFVKTGKHRCPLLVFSSKLHGQHWGPEPTADQRGPVLLMFSGEAAVKGVSKLRVLTGL